MLVPSARAVFTGDLVFNGGTPIAWAGPIANWTAACETIAALDVDWIVPGHGPVASAQDGSYAPFVPRHTPKNGESDGL